MSRLNTELMRGESSNLDQRSNTEILAILHKGQVEAAIAVEAAIESLEKGAEAMADAVRNGKQLVYAAAGSSGLQGMADGLEITPTFGVPISQVQILRAGGLEDLSRPKGEAEDNVEAARRDAAVIKAGDCVICLAASGSTTYTGTVMHEARKRGATTIGMANNPETALLSGSDIPILLSTPPEVIAGSTRLGAGTAQKIALNMMSTLMGVLLGHVVDGLMVNVIANNEKLFRRAEDIVMQVIGCDRSTAATSLKETSGSVKEAALIASGAKDYGEALSLLEASDGNLRTALKTLRWV
jgi:N-acetylmuramic acid 6-phosphate etherase